MFCSSTLNVKQRKVKIQRGLKIAETIQQDHFDSVFLPMSRRRANDDAYKSP